MAIAKIMAFLLVSLCIAKGGLSACSLSDIRVSQSPTGRTVAGATEHAVVVSNGCICSQSNLVLSCGGFSSAVEPVDAEVLRPTGDGRCLVNGGQPVQQDVDIKFNYASSSQVSFSPASSQVDCS